jgi:CPA2 family monovalent cation:H+ antiporter-2
MIATPFSAMLVTPLYKLKKRLFKYEPLQTENIPYDGLKEHVIIAGGGRVGQYIAQMMKKLNVPFVIVEINHQRMLECKAAGFPVIFGDLGQATAIGAAKVIRAKLLLITTPSVIVSQTIVKHAHQLKPDLHIVVRAEGLDQMKELYEEGVYMVVLPEMEAGLEIARQALLHLSVPVTAIQEYTDDVRRQLYAPIYQTNQDYHLLDNFDNLKTLLEISWVKLIPESPLLQKTIRDSSIRSKTGASVVGVIHKKLFFPNPKADYSFQEGDLVAVVGSLLERNEFKKLAGLL